MKIELITKEQHDEILAIQNSHAILTYDNKDYDCFDKSKMTDDDIVAFKKIEDILKKHIKGFSSFQNFKPFNEKGDLRLRFQYNYEYDGGLPFIGVGYITLRELMNGFDS